MKKIPDNLPLFIRGEILLAMKLTIILIFLGVMKVSASAYSQNAKLALNFHQVSVEQVFEEIKSQSDFTFLYRSDLIKGLPKVSLLEKEASIEKVLDQILVPHNLAYEIYDNTVVIRKEKIKVYEDKPILQEDLIIEIKGTVTDENGEPLPGATILVKGTSNGTVTDMEGNFYLEIGENTTLIVSFLGYKVQEIEVNNRSVIDVLMEPDLEGLEEVVVVGYGLEVNKRDVTGSVSKANLENAQGTTNVSIIQALQGSVPGLNVGAVTNAGENPVISIRGQSTLSSNAEDNEPLVVLDGIIYRGNIIDINPADIKSIDVLKDVSSAAIYGSQGSNGVILITTKSGKTEAGKPLINYSVTHSVQSPSNEIKPMRAAEYEEFYKDVFWMEGSRLAPDYIQPNPDFDLTSKIGGSETIRGYNEGIDTPWYDLFTGNGYITTHNLSVQGNSDSFNYFTSAGYTDQQAFIKGDKYKRYNFRANLESSLNSWLKIGTQTFITASDYSGVDPGAANLYSIQPWAPIYDKNGEYEVYVGPLVNPYLSAQREDYDVRINLSNLLYGEVKLPLKGLKYRVNFANNYRTGDKRYFDPNANSFNGEAYQANSMNWDYTLDNIISYDNTFNAVHHVSATLLYGVEERKFNDNRAGANNLEIDLLGYDYLQAGDPSLNEVSSSREKENSIYQMARVGYDYARKYYVTGTVRRDGFSGFGTNKKTGVFPSVAVGWVVTNEPILSDTEWLDFLKLRASYGKSGRRSVGRYGTLARASLGPSYVFGDGGSPQLGQSVTSLGNNDLGWETTIGSNFAIDFEIFQSKITGTMEYYQNTTNDILYSIVIPRITGFNDITTNIAEVSNHGIELSLNAKIIDDNNFSWNASLNYSRVRNKINSIIGADNDGGGIEDDLTASGLFIGEPQNVIYDYEVSGMWQLADQENETIWNGFMPGTYKLTDLNGDGEISLLDDRKILGYQDPSYRVGLANTLRYKNFSLYVFFNSIQGGKNYYLGNDTPHNSPYWGKRDQLGYINVPSGAWDYWMPENPNAKYRRLDNPSTYGGSPYTQRSFIRLQDVSLTYALPDDLMNKLHLKGLSFSLAGKNLATWTKWIGSDPETGVGFEPGVPLLTSISLGMNVQF